MTRTARLVVLIIGVVGTGVALVWAMLFMPGFGGTWHPYRDRAAAAALAHVTANAVSSVNFDQRALDTFGEESILLGSVVGVAVLLRPAEGERRRKVKNTGHVLDSTRLLVTLAAPLTLVIGVDVVAHGAITPGGGFQGGVILATGLHLIYVGGRYSAFDRLRPLGAFSQFESVGVIAFAAIGLVGLAAGGAWLGNVVPRGQLAQLLSAGTVPLLNAAVGLAVGGGVVILLAHFLEQRLLSWPPRSDASPTGRSEGEEQI